MKKIQFPYITWTIILFIIAAPLYVEFNTDCGCDSSNQEVIAIADISNGQSYNNITSAKVGNDSVYFIKNVVEEGNVTTTTTTTVLQPIRPTNNDYKFNSGWWTVLYVILCVASGILFIIYLVDSDYLIFKKLKHLPTKGGSYFYNLQARKITVYKNGIFWLTQHKVEYCRASDIKNVIDTLNSIASDIDKDNFAYTKEELKNWKRTV